MKREMVTLFIVGLLILMGSNKSIAQNENKTYTDAIDQLYKNDKPSWYNDGKQSIKKYNIMGRVRTDIPDTKVPSNVGYGKVINIMEIPSITLNQGVTAKAYWGIGTLMSFITMEPNSFIEADTLSGERFMFVLKGNVQELVNGKYVTMKAIERETPDGIHALTPRQDFVYLQKGSLSSIKAGEAGAKILEVYSPVPPYYLKKYGAINIPPEISLSRFPIKPTVEPNKVYDLYDIQYSELVPGTNSRLISGMGAMLSFLRMNPNTGFARHIHPEEQVMIARRGWIDEDILDRTVRMKQGDIVRLPGDYAHGGQLGPYGCDGLDVFFPPRYDYEAHRVSRMAGYHAIIPEDSKINLVIDGANSKPGLTFTEGPTWLNGKLYFSNIYFDKDFNGDPGKSSLVEMDEDGQYRYIIQDKMLTNGLMPARDGNLIVCDMFGHRLIEVNTAGNIHVVKVLADEYNGKSLDGPNDLVVDSKGGIYFTDPQFTPEKVKNQPGRTAYYLNPKGKLIRILEPNSFAMPNGIILSPDGKTLYIDNTYDDDPSWNVNSDKDNFVWAYDVNSDGTISNGRKFAELYLTSEVLNEKSKTSGADGMTIDALGNIYVATYKGVQIFNSKGDFIGIINFPTYPTNLCFGGKDFKTLYVVSHDKVYSIHTNVKGYMVSQ
jgi:gluconolactonase